MILPCAAGSHKGLHFFDGNLLEEGILRVDNDGQRVKGNRHFDVLNACGLAISHFFGW
jgi:hypothetical protein